MKRSILIVRTVSVEKLSPVLDACVARWPEHPLVVVTSPGREGELRLDPRIAAIVPYAMVAAGFSAPIEYASPVEAVVVPVANRGGSGYANVLRACRRLRATSWFLASYSRTLTPVSRCGWAWRWRSELALGYPARWLGCIWSAAIRRSVA